MNDVRLTFDVTDRNPLGQTQFQGGPKVEQTAEERKEKCPTRSEGESRVEAEAISRDCYEQTLR